MLLPKRLGEKGLMFRYRINKGNKLTREQVDKDIKGILFSVYLVPLSTC